MGGKSKHGINSITVSEILIRKSPRALTTEEIYFLAGDKDESMVRREILILVQNKRISRDGDTYAWNLPALGEIVAVSLILRLANEPLSYRQIKDKAGPKSEWMIQAEISNLLSKRKIRAHADKLEITYSWIYPPWPAEQHR